MNLSADHNAVDSRLLAIGQHLRQREQHRLKLTSYAAADYKHGAAGVEMARLLDTISNEEKLALSELVHLHDDVAHHLPSGGGDGDLCILERFHAFQAAKTIAFGCSGLKHYYSIVSRTGGPTGRDMIHDVRFFVEWETRVYQMLELAHDLVQFWELFLRYHTTLDLKGFSADVQRGLRGRVTDTVFHQATRRLMPISEVAPASAPIEVLQAEIVTRLGDVAFNLEERDIFRSKLATYTVRTLADASNEDAKRDMTRIRNVERALLHELIHLADSVRKWLGKQGRAAELAVIEKCRPYRIGANLVNVLKHGVRGRGRDCAVIEADMVIVEQAHDVATPDDCVRDVLAMVNYKGELYSLCQLIEDIAQLWQLFLRHHSQMPLDDFQMRLGKTLSSKKEMSTYSVPIPDKLKTWAKREADKRKQLDIK